MDRITAWCGAPQSLRVDDGPEFVLRARPGGLPASGQARLQPSGEPTDNALGESFNGRIRDECLKTNWFLSLDDASTRSEARRKHYNESRPHTVLG
jgi:putative transposase